MYILYGNTAFSPSETIESTDTKVDINKVVAVCGGDGTMAEVASGLLDMGVPLGDSTWRHSKRIGNGVGDSHQFGAGSATGMWNRKQIG